MKARKRFSRVVASTLTLALLLGMLPMAAFAADPDYAPTVAELKNMTMENVLNAEEISLYSNGEMTNYFYRGINLSNNALVKVGYTLEQSQPASLALYKMAEGDEWTGDEVELVPGDTTDPEPFLADFVGYLYGTRVLDNIDNPDEEAEEVTGHQLSREIGCILSLRLLLVCDLRRRLLVTTHMASPERSSHWKSIRAVLLRKTSLHYRPKHRSQVPK